MGVRLYAVVSGSSEPKLHDSYVCDKSFMNMCIASSVSVDDSDDSSECDDDDDSSEDAGGRTRYTASRCACSGVSESVSHCVRQSDAGR